MIGSDYLIIEAQLFIVGDLYRSSKVVFPGVLVSRAV